jgi:hypothetical protein
MPVAERVPAQQAMQYPAAVDMLAAAADMQPPVVVDMLAAAAADMQAVVVVDTQAAVDTSNRRLRNLPAVCTKGGGAYQLRRSCVCRLFSSAL